MDINEQVATNVRQAMENKKESIAATAEKSGIAYATFHRKLNGGGSFTMSELGRLADTLNIHPAQLMPAEFTQEKAA